MLEHINKIRAVTTRKDIRRFVWLLLVFIAVGLFEMGGIASILPFMKLVAQPEFIHSNEWLSWAYVNMGFGSERAFLIAAGVAVLLLLASANAVMLFGNWLQHKFVWSSAHTLATRLLSNYAYQPYEFIVQHNSSDLGQKVLSEVDLFATQVLQPSVDFVSKTCVVMCILGLVIFVDPVLAITLFVGLGGTFALVYAGLHSYLTFLGHARLEANRLRFRTSMETLSNAKVMKTRGCEQYFIRKFSKASKRIAQLNPTFYVVSSSPSYILQTLAFGSIIGIILYMLWQGQRLESFLPILALYALGGYRLLPLLQSTFSSGSRIRFHTPTLDAIHEDLKLETTFREELTAEEEVSVRTNGKAGDLGSFKFEDSIQLIDLTFSYAESEERILDRLNLTIRKGERVAFVGQTGSGKTTLVDVAMGLLKPQSGALVVDGEPITDRNVRRWRSILGYVPQDVVLYDDTLTRNIAFGVEEGEIDKARVVEVAQIANIHDFVTQELRDGYDTLIGERGVRLSGGQRQRIGLARALYHDPQVLVLDEATSALDGITETAVMDSIARVEYETTVIMIAHRLATVRRCDYIHLIDKGQIVASGTYAELLEENTMFQGMATVAN